MATFLIRRTVDAYVYYETKVEATSAKEAVTKARENEDGYSWTNVGESTFDARSFVALHEEGGEIEDTRQGDL